MKIIESLMKLYDFKEENPFENEIPDEISEKSVMEIIEKGED
ncbi:hypothetical protein [Leptotrichia sp. OH3620_COT-345]|nr:hypothetical protein [Leptotrichia sp. OH3620_COT-345]